MCLILLISPRSHSPAVKAVACRAGRPRFYPSTFQKFFSCQVVVKKLITCQSKIVQHQKKITLAALLCAIAVLSKHSLRQKPLTKILHELTFSHIVWDGSYLSYYDHFATKASMKWRVSLELQISFFSQMGKTILGRIKGGWEHDREWFWWWRRASVCVCACVCGCVCTYVCVRHNVNVLRMKWDRESACVRAQVREQERGGRRQNWTRFA